MGRLSTLEEAREYFSCDKFATENGMTLDEIDEAHAVTSMTLGERHKNAFGGVMGGAIFTLADFAFAALTNDRERLTVAQQVSVNYLAAPKGGQAEAPAGAELIAELTRDMLEAADNLEFERAAYLRDQIAEIRKSVATRPGNLV